MHHAFTRYHQPELDLRGRASGFMDRAGNELAPDEAALAEVAAHNPLSDERGMTRPRKRSAPSRSRAAAIRACSPGASAVA